MVKYKKKTKQGRKPHNFLPASKMRYMRKIFPIIKMLGVANPETRSALLSTMDNSAFHTVCECIKNVVQNPNLISSEEKNIIRGKIGPGKKQIRQFLNSKMSLPARRRKGIQIGGFLSTLLGVAIPILSQLLFKAFKK